MKILLFLCISFWASTINAQAANNICEDSSSVASTGSLTDSGGANGHYNNKESCQFLIQSTAANTITLSFSAFNFEDGYDFVQIYDGTSTSDILLGTYTGSSVPSDVTATSGAMLVVNTTDYSINQSGFQATWITTPRSSCSAQSVADSFPAISYSHNSGSTNWSGDWTEIGESDGASSGIARVRSDLCTSGYCLRLGVPSGNTPQTYSNKGVYRETDLTEALSATLSFVYRKGVNQGSQFVILSISNNGGRSWTQLQSYLFNSTNTSPVYASFDISAYAASNTQIRFLASGNNAESGMYIDDIDISYQLSCTPSPILNYRFDACIYTGGSGDVIDQNDNFNGDSNGESLTSNQAIINNSLNLTANDTSDWVDVPSNAVDGLDDFSVSVWFQTSINKPQQQIFHALGGGDDDDCDDDDDDDDDDCDEDDGADADDDELEIFLRDSNTVYIKVRDNREVLSSNIILTNGSWHHLVVTRVNEYVCLYIDGVKQQCKYGVESGVLSVKHSNAIVIGQEQDSFGGSFETRQNFEGQLDEFKIYAIALAPSEITHIYQNELAGNNFDGSTREASVCQVNHYEIQHNGQGFTCEAKDLTVKACANEDCSIPYTGKVSITLAPSGWDGVDFDDSSKTFTFENDEGTTDATLSITGESIVTLTIDNAEPAADLLCFNGKTEISCEIEFVNDGFEFYGETTNDPLSDQLAAENFSDVNLRAVRGENGVCDKLLEGKQNITLGYDCDFPNICLTPFSNIPLNTANSDGYSYATVEVEFDEFGIANLAMLNYPDAGSLKLTASAVIDGVTINAPENGTPIDVYPSYLELNVGNQNLNYGGNDTINDGLQNNYVAGESFTFEITAHGVNGEDLPNYTSKTPEIKVIRLRPSNASSKNGTFKYSASGTLTTALETNATFVTATGLDFKQGKHSEAAAYYSEVGRIEIEFQDANYLGNKVELKPNTSLTLGNFYPAFLKVKANEPTLANSCTGFSYIGQTIEFSQDPILTVTAYNALGTVTQNYSGNGTNSDSFWNFNSDAVAVNTHLERLDSSGYIGSATPHSIEADPTVGNNTNYDGTGTIMVTGITFQYDKVSASNVPYGPVIPFNASIDLLFTADFFNTTFSGQDDTISNTICVKTEFSSEDCQPLSIDKIGDTRIRDGRLVLESVYGPETESLRVPVKVQYYDDNHQWLLNKDDFCTDITFTEQSGQIQLTDNTTDNKLVNAIALVTSSGNLIQGQSGNDDFVLSAPGAEMTGDLDIWLVPSEDETWPNYLNYNWNHANDDDDNTIDSNDYPKATVTFGLFRGNDRVIHWREVFN